jgi:hypothetical protein
MTLVEPVRNIDLVELSVPLSESRLRGCAGDGDRNKTAKGDRWEIWRRRELFVSRRLILDVEAIIS